MVGRQPSVPVPSGLLWLTAAGEQREAPRERVRHPRVGYLASRRTLPGNGRVQRAEASVNPATERRIAPVVAQEWHVIRLGARDSDNGHLGGNIRLDQ